MKTILTLAWRNVWRHRRRSLITMSAIVFSMLIVALSISVQDGTYDGMERAIVRLFTGDIQIHHDGFFDDPSFSKSLSEGDRAVVEAVDAPWVSGTTRRLSGFGLVSSDSTSTGAFILGIDPESEQRVTSISSRFDKGRWLSSDDDHGVVLGAVMARNIEVGVGDTVVVLTQGFRNEMGADLYTVIGTINSGSPEIDRTMMVMNLDDAQFLFSMPGRYTELVLSTTDFDQSDRWARELEKQLGGPEYEVMTWKDLMPELVQARSLDDAGNFIFYMFLIVLLGFEIFNTSTMSVLERVREFGVLQSIGMKPRQITTLVVVELLIKVALSLLVGLILLLVLAAIFGDNAIPVTGELREMYEDWGFYVESITFSTQTRTFTWPLKAVGIVSLIAIVYPVLKLQGFSPIQALRYS